MHKILIILIAILAATFSSSVLAQENDSTSTVVILDANHDSHNWILHPVPISFMFQELTSSVEMYISLTKDKFFFSGVTINPNENVQGIVSYRANSLDTMKVAFAWSTPTLQADSIATIWLTPRQWGSGSLTIHNFLFNERGNDGVDSVYAMIEVLPFSEHPLVDLTQEGTYIHIDSINKAYLPRDTAYALVQEHYILRSYGGDVTCNGTITAFDASVIMQLAVGFSPAIKLDDPDECVTPIIFELLQ